MTKTSTDTNYKDNKFVQKPIIFTPNYKYLCNSFFLYVLQLFKYVLLKY